MGIGYIISVATLPVITIITFIFFYKEKLKNAETEIYGNLLVTAIIMTMSEIVSALLFKYAFDSFIYKVVAKMVLLSYIVVFYLFLKYIMSVCNKSKKIIKFVNLLTMTIFLLTAFTETTYMEVNNLVAPTGFPVLLVYVYSICSEIYELILIIKNRKNVISKKFTPLYVLWILGTINTVISFLNPTLFTVGYVICLVILIMYFTIENPDVKLGKELAYQKQIAEASTNKTLDLLEDMSNELNSSIQKLDEFGNKKIDKKDHEELKKEITNFQKESITLSNRISNILDLAMIKSDESFTEKKYETSDLINKLKQLLTIDNKLKITVSDELPVVLYGDEKNIIKLVIYLLNTITSLSNTKNISLKLDSIQVGRFSRLRFKFILPSETIKDYLYLNTKTNEIELKINDDITKKLITTTLKKFNGKLFISENNEETSISMFINQRVITEYDIISNNKVNKDITIEYQDYSSKRILIIDNNTTKNKEMKELLKPYNLDIRFTNSIPQTVNTLNRNATFDLIFIDENIANINNNEILKEIKKEANYSITTIIMVNPNYNEKEYLKHGYNDYIIKPINKKNLDNTLNKHFNKKER